MKRGACAVLWQGGQILLGRRSPRRKFYPGVWDLIGGHCEGEETPQQTLVRELGEELGVTPIQFRQVDILDEPNTAAHGAYQYYVYLVTQWRGEPCNRQPQEHAEIKWFAVQDALALELAHPHYPVLFKEIIALGN
ncbi:MAG: NUDIX domain-containing protein [Candidatus Latescibacteria bacterium]|nr:NUDIX domain-containing protein [Candidatus Latescibacterota bacterium]